MSTNILETVVTGKYLDDSIESWIISNIEDFIENTPEMKSEQKKRMIFGEKFGKAVATHLKDYAVKNDFPKIYKEAKGFILNAIKYYPINGFDVQISKYQDGIDYDYIYIWKKDHPEACESDWQKAPEFNTEWYDKLRDEGNDCIQSIFEKMQAKQYTVSCSNGDGDEGIVYININFTDEYRLNIRDKIVTKYKDEIDMILNNKYY